MEAALDKLPAWHRATDETPESRLVIRENHWAVGWVEWIAIHESDTGALKVADELATGLEDYPVIDESDLSEREMEAANQIWKDCYRVSERIKYIREHRSQFEFSSMADLLACVRGNYFAGYASDILS